MAFKALYLDEIAQEESTDSKEDWSSRFCNAKDQTEGEAAFWLDYLLSLLTKGTRKVMEFIVLHKENLLVEIDYFFNWLIST